MLGWLMVGASCVIMSRVADAEGRNGLMWGALTFAICLGSSILIPWPLIDIGIGLFLSFMALFAVKVISD